MSSGNGAAGAGGGLAPTGDAVVAGGADDRSVPVVRLRVLGPDDVEQVAALEVRIFPEDPWTSGMVAEELAAAGRHYVGAEVGGELVGYAGIHTGPDADVMTIGVLSSCRGRGVGSQLLADLIDAARAAGSERVFLEVRASNGAAQGLYVAHGFHRIGRVRHYFRHPREDAVTMRLDLRGPGIGPVGAPL